MGYSPCCLPRDAPLNFPEAGTPGPPSAELLARLSGQYQLPLSSKYRGVTLKSRTGQWQAQIRHGGKNVHLGTLSSEEEAALAYDTAAHHLLGT